MDRFASRLLYLFVISVCTFFSCKQNDVSVDRIPSSLDSTIEIANSIKENGDTARARKYVDSAYSRMTNITVKDKFDYYHFYYDLANDRQDDRRIVLYTDSMIWLLESTNSMQKLSAQYAIATYTKADRLFDQNNFTEAFKYYHKAKEIAKTNNDSCILGYFNYKLGIVLYHGEQFNKAIYYFKEAHNGLASCGDWLPYYYRKQELEGNIGICYNKIDMYDSALVHFNRSLDIIEKGKVKYPAKLLLFERAEGVALGNMGSAYVGLGQYDKAEDVFTRSIAINERKDYVVIDAQYTRVKLAELYVQKGELPLAKLQIDIAAHVLDSLPDMEVQMRLYKARWHYAAAEKQGTDINRYQIAYYQLKDSMNSLNRKVYQLDLDGRVMNMERQEEINILEKTNESRDIYLVLALFACLMSVIIGMLIYLNWRESRKNIAKLTELNEHIIEKTEAQKATLKELGKATEEKDRILKAVSHDMRSPVNSALALTGLLLAEKENFSDDQLGYIELIKDSCNNALLLTKDLLEVATMKNEPLKKEWADVNILVKSVGELLTFKAAEKNQQLTILLSDVPVIVQLNKEKIARVVNNLVNNAVKFSSSGSEILLNIEKQDDSCIISVKDNGIGIPENMRDKIFDVFTEAKRFGTSGEQPYGLGLSICKQIVDAHGGKIWFESIPGTGTTFYISLPVTAV